MVILALIYDAICKILFEYLKAQHQISPELEIEQAMMLLTSAVPMYGLPDLNAKTPDTPQSRGVLY